MGFSGNQIKRLGKALRKGEVTGDLVRELEDYRSSFDPLLIDLSLEMERLTAEVGIPCLLTGRSKRTKSIIRKLRRQQNQGMDLSRMADIVGLRLIVGTVGDQSQMLNLLVRSLDPKDIHDYRDSPPPSGYRCVHLNVRRDRQLIEIQLRTLSQHLWAIESESFGEHAKEGNLKPEESDYLLHVAEGVRLLERGEQPPPIDPASPSYPLAQARAPFTEILRTLEQRFHEAARGDGADEKPGSFLLIYDRLTGQLLHEFQFDPSERDKALKDYAMFSRMVDETRFDVLVLNARGPSGLRVTHPQFF